MTQVKICPLMKEGCSSRCGWYDEKRKCCVLLSINWELDFIGDQI